MSVVGKGRGTLCQVRNKETNESEEHARMLKQKLEGRLAECKLTLHPEKTKIVFCKQANRRTDYPIIQFDFLGYTFRPRSMKTRTGRLSVSFSLAVSNKATRAMRQQTYRGGPFHRYDLDLNELAGRTRPTLLGWIQYYWTVSPIWIVVQRYAPLMNHW